ncbi:PAAR domain-containing protein [Pseudomonas sp.]|uniref:PAAR domain-containing protein n=1 Tax=Pseudomonas sp. TaxID=306 RepID=UPI002BD56BD9|nr:PAAR domain-containing protein [Pseudomonas sp.]HUE92617.1 PAAR domain-containing protein [Pseudomonas sp.]
MSGKPAARVTDPTACPVPGHGTNPIVAGSSDVLFDGLNAARLSDVSACGSPIASNVSPTVFINGLNAATLGSVGAHGNTIIAGSGTVIIGNSGGGAPFIPVTPLNIQAAFNDRFQLLDSRSGRPLAHRNYAVKHEDGRLEYGQSDDQGFTSLIINPSRAETIEIYIED